MNKIIIFLAIFLFAANSIWAQATPTAAYRIFNNTTAMGVSMSVGSQVFDLTNKKLYVAIRAVPTTITIETGLADPNPYFKEISGITLSPNPSVQNVSISGTMAIGIKLTGNYTYIASQATGSTEGSSVFKWYYASDASGAGKTAISGATAKTYTVASPVIIGSYVAFGVTPVSADGKTGTEILSTWQKVITAASDGTVVVELTSPSGRIWMDRNLGASQVATSTIDHLAYGSLFQWCRKADGHEKINWTNSVAGVPLSGTTGTLSSSSTVSNSLFITPSSAPYDWLSTQKSDGSLWWSGTTTEVNNPCPVGYHVPTKAEWDAEIQQGITTATTAYNLLKLPKTSFRSSINGSLNDIGTIGCYWSSSVYSTYAYSLHITTGSVSTNTDNRASGLSVRCVKNMDAPQAQSVSVSGTVAIGSTLTGNYSYLPPQTTGTTEGTSIYKWYYATDASGSGKAVLSGATAKTYTIASPVVTGNYIAFGVTPVSADGKTGTETLSSWVKVQSLPAPDGTPVVELTSSSGRIWMDRNLGASRAATSSTDDNSYGSLFQWCRRADGHQLRTSSTQSTRIAATTTGNSNFIIGPDWSSTSFTDGSLWWNSTTSTAGGNNPCPAGYHVPTQAEWQTEVSAGISNSATAYSRLNLPMGGYRSYGGGSPLNTGSAGYYWGSSFISPNGYYLIFGTSFAEVSNANQATGFSVRCIKNQ